MGTDRNRYHIKINATTYEFQGAKYVYDKIKSKIGAKEVTQRTTGATGLRNQGKPVKNVEELRESVPRLRLVLKVNRLGNSAQNSQGSRTRRVDIYVDPAKFESALRTLPGTVVGGFVGVGDFYVDSVSIPRRRYYR